MGRLYLLDAALNYPDLQETWAFRYGCITRRAQRLGRGGYTFCCIVTSFFCVCQKSLHKRTIFGFGLLVCWVLLTFAVSQIVSDSLKTVFYGIILNFWPFDGRR